MNEPLQLDCEVAVIGAGPAGIAAATTAAEAGLPVVLLDDNPQPGGQIWRGETKSSERPVAARWLSRLEATAVRKIHSARVFLADQANLFAELPSGVAHVTFRKLIVAAGSRERFLPFPGWTLPGVMGAGGLQALIKAGLPVNGKRVVIAGTGPLLLAVAAFAAKHGASVVCIAEQTSLRRLARFGFSALLSKKSREAAELLWQLRGVPYWKNAWPVASLGETAVERVQMSHNGAIRDLACDYLACGYDLVPSIELAQLLGCSLRDGFVVVDENQKTSIAEIYCAGEMTGIGGAERSLLQGRIAGYAAAGQISRAQELFSKRNALERHVRAQRKAFALRIELKSLPQEKTLICRCEDVAFGNLRLHNSWRLAKLLTRCGMGPCQGRVCGAAAQFLFGWDTGEIRPPVFPVSTSSLAAAAAGASSEPLQGEIQ
jgi:NADPH-dependent 2,4-dienoyl-CoA reductase/sulfur reductase-like enzyme